ncbi:MAG: hypothetical protein ACON4U_12550 [Myxococcota bacterium]
MKSAHSIDTIQSKLEHIVKEELGWTSGIPKGDLSSELDSVQRLSLIVAIEDTFEICFEPEDESAIHNIGDLSQCILRLVESQS